MWNPDDHPELLNEDLQAAIQAIAASDTPTTRRQLYEVLLAQTYCVLHSQEPDGATTVTGIRSADGAAHLVAFSDPAALRRWDPDAISFLTMTADRFFQMAKDSVFDAVSLNPAGPAGGIIRRHEFTALADGRLPDVAPAVQPSAEPNVIAGSEPEQTELILRYKRRKMLPMLFMFLFLSGFIALIFPHLLHKEHLTLNERFLFYGGPVCVLIMMPFTLGLICSVILPRPSLHLTQDGITVTDIFYNTKKEPWTNIAHLKFRTVEAANGSNHMLKVYKTGGKILGYVHLDFLRGSLETNKRDIEAYFARICARK